MFYCEECKNRMEWPSSLAKSKGPCEVCGKVTICYDVPSKYLPPPETHEDIDQAVFENILED